jgi:glycosyltransferase involved in cell wall biosynthesis
VPESEPIDVWYLIGTLDVGGTERTLLEVLRGLDRDCFAPHVWTLTGPGQLATALPDDVPLTNLDAAHKADVRILGRFLRHLRRERPAILQSFLYFDNLLARVAGAAVPGTTVITGVREVPNHFERHRDLLDRATMRGSDFIVSNSRAGAEWVVERGADSERVRVVPNGRRVATYDVSLPAGYRERLDVPAGPVVGTVGRLVERKGQHDLIEAWPTVRSTQPAAQLVVVGDGPERSALAARADQLGVAASVHLLGRRRDVPALLALFDVFAFPSHYEGLPGALLEAMCAGLPIVTTPVDGAGELVTDGEHGLHVPPEDPAALADAIGRLLSDDALASRLGDSARSRAAAEYSVEAMVDAYERLYEAVLDDSTGIYHATVPFRP